MEFPYVKSDGGFGPVYRPVLPVTISAGARSFPVGHALVDTGADMTLMPLAIAHLLEIPLDDSRTLKVGGAGGGTFAALPSLRMIGFALEQHGHRPIVWRGTAYFSPDQPAVLLGHHQCLELLSLHFRGPQRMLEVVMK